MSDIQVKDALLYGISPNFPVTLIMLRKAQEATGCTNGHALEEVAKTVPGFINKDRPTTSDGYSWFWALNFQRGDTKIAILFPRATDYNSPDGNKQDRSSAVYVLAGKWNTEVASILFELREKMFELAALQRLLD